MPFTDIRVVNALNLDQTHDVSDCLVYHLKEA